MRIGWIAIGGVAVVALYAIFAFNRLIRGRNLLLEGFSGIGVQLRRRNDLIPSLVEVVKGYAGHERSLFEAIAARRASALAASDVPAKAAAEQRLQGPMRRLFALAEGYPELKANQNFLALQGQIAELEDQLQMARRYYNGAVRDFNISIQSFPDVLIARATGFREQPFFQIDDASGAVPAVEFSGARAP
jgi:LemA protein